MSKSKIIISLLAVILLVFLLFIFLGKKDKSTVNLDVMENDNASSTVVVSTSTKSSKSVKVNSTTQKSVTKDQATSDSSEFLVISYTKDGFSPKEVQIQKGRAVKFVNNSNSSMQVIFDDSKSQFYSEFSQSKSVGRGGSYIINFVYSGVWSFHNEFNKNHKVNVVVY
jgi:plastocyanin